MSGMSCRAIVKFHRPENGGKVQMPEGDGYAPYARVGEGGELRAIRILGLPLDGKFGESYSVELELTYHPQLDYSAILPGGVFQLVEGRRIVGEGRIV